MTEPEVQTPEEVQAEAVRAEWLTGCSNGLYFQLARVHEASDIVAILTMALGVAIGANVQFELLDVVLDDVGQDIRRQATAQVHRRMMGGDIAGSA